MTINGTLVISKTPPLIAKEGVVWIDTSTQIPRIKYFSGGGYIPLNAMVKQTVGDSTTQVMSQKSVTDELELKANQTDLAQLADEFQKVLEFFQVGYWVHKDTGVKTYFGLDDPLIVDGIMNAPSWKDDCSEVKIPLGVTGIGYDCFYGCTSLTSINIPIGVTSIGYSCFAYCTSLTSINIPVGVTSLGSDCFYGCTSLTSITIPESVTNLGDSCFNECSSLTLATVLPAIPPSLGSLAFDMTGAGFNIKVQFPYVDDYKTATNWIEFADKISAI